jgi:hypothetical protein
MFQIPGLSPVSPVQHPDEGNLYLRVNQRVAGEVIKVANDQVILSIQGVQVVARLSTPDQTLALMDRRFAQFIVKDLKDQVLTLQLVEQNNTGVPKPIGVNREAVLLKGLLDQIGIKPDAQNQSLAQAAIRNGLPVTAQLLQELSGILKPLQPWGDTEANLAALLKSQQVPVSPDTIRLLAKSPAEVTQSMGNIIYQLDQLLKTGNLSLPMRDQVARVLETFSQAIIRGDLPTDELVSRLKNAVTLLGKSIEGELARSGDPNRSELELGLLALTRLRTELAARGHTGIAGEIDRLNEYLRLVHIMNAESNELGQQNKWIQLELPVHYPVATANPAQPDLHPARIRIAREQDSDGHTRVNPNYTRIVLQVDLSDNQAIEVDLSVVSKQIGLAITGTDPDVARSAGMELDQLKAELSDLGYETRYSQVDTGKLQKTAIDPLSSSSTIDGAINMEV